jgi:serine/threonine-protein kinase RsbW
MDKQQVRLFPGRYDQIRNICDFILQGAEVAGLDETAVFHVEFACDEACTNIIEHAYGGENRGEIKIGWEIEGPWFVITIGDQGRASTRTPCPARKSRAKRWGGNCAGKPTRRRIGRPFHAQIDGCGRIQIR